MFLIACIHSVTFMIYSFLTFTFVVLYSESELDLVCTVMGAICIISALSWPFLVYLHYLSYLGYFLLILKNVICTVFSLFGVFTYLGYAAHWHNQCLMPL